MDRADAADAARTFLDEHRARLARVARDPPRALVVVRALARGLEEELPRALPLPEAAEPPSAAEARAVAAGEAGARAAWALHAVRAERHAALLALAGLEDALVRWARGGADLPLQVARAEGSRARVLRALGGIAEALDAWEGRPAREVPAREWLLRAREAHAAGEAERALVLAARALDGIAGEEAEAWRAVARELRSAAVVAPRLLDAVEVILDGR